MNPTSELPALVERWNAGDTAARERIVELVYDDLRAIAHRHLESERDDHTLSTTALVHEAYVAVSRRTGPEWKGRARFFALLSRVMRNVLIDHARRHRAAKRGGGQVLVPFDEEWAGVDAKLVELLSLEEALEKLEGKDERLARIVECRFFGGMPERDIAEALGVSSRTVERGWSLARAYLFTVLSAEGGPGEATS